MCCCDNITCAATRNLSFVGGVRLSSLLLIYRIPRPIPLYFAECSPITHASSAVLSSSSETRHHQLLYTIMYQKHVVGSVVGIGRQNLDRTACAARMNDAAAAAAVSQFQIRSSTGKTAKQEGCCTYVDYIQLLFGMFIDFTHCTTAVEYDYIHTLKRPHPRCSLFYFPLDALC